MNQTIGNKIGKFPQPQGLYDPGFEHDTCGVGFVANIQGEKSHAIVEKGIEVLINLQHRGAIGGDLTTGDGAGVLFQLPDAFFRRAAEGLSIQLPDQGEYGVGMIFFPQADVSREQCIPIVEKIIENEGLGFLGWRDVPVDESVIAGQAKESRPVIRQCFIEGKGLAGTTIQVHKLTCISKNQIILLAIQET